MSDSIWVATIWDDATRFSSPLERRWFRTEDAAQEWVANNHERNQWWHIEAIECGDELALGETE